MSTDGRDRVITNPGSGRRWTTPEAPAAKPTGNVFLAEKGFVERQRTAGRKQRGKSMGRGKEYRQRLKYQVGSVMRKTMESRIAVTLVEELGMSVAESRLLSRRLKEYFCRQSGSRAPNEILLEAASGRERFVRNGKGTKSSIRIAPFDQEDLSLELELGLSTMQAGRIARMIEQAYVQDALLSVRQLVWLTNITPTSLRGRLGSFRELGIHLPYLGLPRQWRAGGQVLRSTWVLARYLTGERPAGIRRKAAMSKERFNDLLRSFALLAFDADSFRPTSGREREEWTALLRSTPEARLREMLPVAQKAGRQEQENDLAFELRRDYGMAPVRVQAVMQVLRELEGNLQAERGWNTAIYWAVASGEPAGKPLSACALVPVALTIVEQEDLGDRAKDPDLNRLRQMKFRKAVRYAVEAKRTGGYLTQADLGYLLGIHPGAIAKLLRENEKALVPLRGVECDIGRAPSHRRRIIELFLEMYTETEIAARTGHSYESIESYLRDFGTVMLLSDQGLSAEMIRKVTGRSPGLVRLYLELLKEYARPRYAFRLNYLRGMMEAGTSRPKKGGFAR